MKKFFGVLAFASVVCLGLASCEKENIEPQEEQTPPAWKNGGGNNNSSGQNGQGAGG